MFHIHIQNQSRNLSNSPYCTCHSRILIFLFYLPLSCSSVIVYLGSHWMLSTVGLEDSNFFLTDLPCLSVTYCHCNLLPQNLLPLGLGQIVPRWGIVVPIHMLLLPTCYSGLIWTITWTITQGIAASFGGAFSSDFSILIKVGVRTSFTWGTGHDDLATNKFVEARTVFGHGVSSLVSRAVNVAVVVALGCCCPIGRLLQLGGKWAISLLEHP